MKKIILILFIFVYGCGYQSIYSNKNIKNLEFKKIIFKGEIDINRKIIKALNIRENELDDSLNQLVLETSYIIEETSKNSKGKVETYRTSTSVNFKIIKDDEILKSKYFIEDFSYNNRDNKFDLVEYQGQIKNNIIDKILEKMIIYINLL
jgi:hypothetical protein|tara:strand:+ start:414 stop:863 length:450 start_codon:yes stop_codon:yes gene_type:complete